MITSVHEIEESLAFRPRKLQSPAKTPHVQKQAIKSPLHNIKFLLKRHSHKHATSKGLLKMLSNQAQQNPEQSNFRSLSS